MMKYAIIRMQKLKSVVAVRRSLQHSYRDQDTPNADPERAQTNTHLGALSSANALEKFNAALPDKIRSNAVLCVEFLVTASPEKMKEMTKEQQNAYFDAALQFIEEKHGWQNVICAGIHRDETTPHMYAYVVPKKDGKLNCRAFYGEKDALSKLQSDFAEHVGKKHELERGIKGSKAKHTSIKKFYADLNKTADLPKLKHPANVPLPATKLLEGKEDYAKRALDGYKQAILKDFVTLRQRAGLNATNAQKALESEKTAKALERELEKARKSFEALQAKHNAQNDGLVAMLSKSDEAAGMQFVAMKRNFEAKEKQKAIEKAEQEKLKQLQPKPKGPRL
jgi:hypothetical protein